MADREESAIRSATSVGFQQVGVLRERIRSTTGGWGNYQDLVLLELPLKDRELWWRF